MELKGIRLATLAAISANLVGKPTPGRCRIADGMAVGGSQPDSCQPTDGWANRLLCIRLADIIGLLGLIAFGYVRLSVYQIQLPVSHCVHPFDCIESPIHHYPHGIPVLQYIITILLLVLSLYLANSWTFTVHSSRISDGRHPQSRIVPREQQSSRARRRDRPKQACCPI